MTNDGAHCALQIDVIARFRRSSHRKHGTEMSALNNTIKNVHHQINRVFKKIEVIGLGEY